MPLRIWLKASIQARLPAVVLSILYHASRRVCKRLSSKFAVGLANRSWWADAQLQPGLAVYLQRGLAVYPSE